MVTTTKFETWLDTLIEEKNIDIEETFDINDNNGVLNIMPYGCVIEAIKQATATEQANIKKTLVKIDFKNGDIRHFFRHLAGAMIN